MESRCLACWSPHLKFNCTHSNYNNFKVSIKNIINTVHLLRWFWSIFRIVSFMWLLLFIQIQIKSQYRDFNTRAVELYASIHLIFMHLLYQPVDPFASNPLVTCLACTIVLHTFSPNNSITVFSFSYYSPHDPLYFLSGTSSFVHLLKYFYYFHSLQSICEVVIISIFKNKQKFFFNSINRHMLSTEDRMISNDKHGLCSLVKQNLLWEH